MGYIQHVMDDGFEMITHYDKVITSVVLIDHHSGIRASGNAKVYEGDEFDLEIGQKLAYLRAFQRYLHKLEKAVSKEPKLAYDVEI